MQYLGEKQCHEKIAFLCKICCFKMALKCIKRAGNGAKGARKGANLYMVVCHWLFVSRHWGDAVSINVPD